MFFCYRRALVVCILLVAAGLNGKSARALPPDNTKTQTCQGILSGIEVNALGLDALFRLAQKTFLAAGPQYWLKFSVILDDTGRPQKLLFQDSSVYTYHADFLKTLPEFAGLDTDAIDKLTLRGPGRRAYLGTLRLDRTIVDNDFVTSAAFQIISMDLNSIGDLAVINASIQKAINNENWVLNYEPLGRLRNETEQNRSALEAAGIRLAGSQRSSKAQTYAAGWGVGTVVRAHAADLPPLISQGLIHSRTVLILDEAPRELLPVAAVIVSTESAPDSHVALLAQSMGIPFSFQPGAFESEIWKDLSQRASNVFVSAKKDKNSTIAVNTQLSEKDAGVLQNLRRTTTPPLATLDLNFDSILSLDHATAGDVARIGGKAAHLAMIRHALGPQHSLAGIGIPFSFFKSFLKQARSSERGRSLKAKVNSLLKAIENPETPLNEILAVLAKIRLEIEVATVPSSLAHAVASAIKVHLGSNNRDLFFRSSSNIEDLPGFNGAGLHDSTRVDATHLSSIQRGLKDVWKSLYNDRAYLMRRHVGISESQVSMAVLVNPFIKDISANGVAIAAQTGNTLVTELVGFPGQHLKITDPTAGLRPETASVHSSATDPDHGNTEILVASSELPLGKNLLQDEEYISVHSLAAKTLEAWKHQYRSSQPLDIEWIRVPQSGGDARSHRMVFLQVRAAPQLQRSGVTELKHSLILPLGQQTFIVEQAESHDAASQFFMPAKIQINSNLMSTEPGRDVAPSIQSIKIVNRDGSESVVYGSSLSTLQFKQDGDRKTLTIPLPHPALPSLKLVLSVLDTKDPQGVLVNPIIGEDLVVMKLQVDQEAGSSPLNWNVYGQEKIGGAPRTINQSYDVVGLHLDVKGETTFTGSIAEKTAFMTLKRAAIIGVLNRSLVITSEAAMIYAPNHHNTKSQLLFDLFAAEGLTAEERATLQERGHRYLVVESVGVPQDGVALVRQVFLTANINH